MLVADFNKNMKIESNIGKDDVVWLNVRTDPFEVYGLYNYREEKHFIRIPENVAREISDGVAFLNTNTAGSRVRFSTNSPYIAIKTVQPNAGLMSNMGILGQRGFDLYVDKDGISTFRTAFRPKEKDCSFESVCDMGSCGMVNYTLNFPLYAGVDELYVGVKVGSEVTGGMKYRNDIPVLFYGSSITQGGCPTRPGNSYEGIISAKYNLNYVNMGFSGCCKAEDVMTDYLREQDMSIFVFDYDHNAPSVEYLQNTHFRFYERFREKKPDVPFVMITKPDSWTWDYEYNCRRRDVIYETFRKAREAGDRNAYFIDGESLFAGEMRDICTVDGCHPNDIGMYRMADVIGNVIKNIMVK